MSPQEAVEPTSVASQGANTGILATIREALSGSRRDLTEGNLRRAIVILAIPMILETAYVNRFAKPLPISADGETAVHRSLGFDHRGRVDVAVTPDQPEGVWLMRYLESRHIPYFAFRAAVPHQATGAHIHVGPGSTRLALSD